MGDFRITIEAVGGHGCGRDAKDGEVVARCGGSSCPDCTAIEFVGELRKSSNVSSAKLEHWPVPGAGCERTSNPGPVDDLIMGIRAGSFATGTDGIYQPALVSKAPKPDDGSGSA